MSKRAKAIKLHEELVVCWRDRCHNPQAANKHKKRALDLALGKKLTASEEKLSRADMMAETCGAF